MDLDRLQFFRALLEQKIAQLSNDQLRVMSGMTVSNERFSDIIDQTSSESDRNFELRIRDRERQLIIKMREAVDGREDMY